jgi:hypothetical protein
MPFQPASSMDMTSMSDGDAIPVCDLSDGSRSTPFDASLSRTRTPAPLRALRI